MNIVPGNNGKPLNHAHFRSAPPISYYCGAKFDTIPTKSTLPEPPSHWRNLLSSSASPPKTAMAVMMIEFKPSSSLPAVPAVVHVQQQPQHNSHHHYQHQQEKPKNVNHGQQQRRRNNSRGQNKKQNGGQEAKIVKAPHQPNQTQTQKTVAHQQPSQTDAPMQSPTISGQALMRMLQQKQSPTANASNQPTVYANSCQANYDSSEHLKSLLKVCT